MPIDPKTQDALAQKVETLTTPQDGSAPDVAASKYLTPANQFIYLTFCRIANPQLPKAKIQVFNRVQGGVEETLYEVFTDGRFTKTLNPMIFGNDTTAGPTPASEADENDAQALTQLLSSLGPHNQRL